MRWWLRLLLVCLAVVPGASLAAPQRAPATSAASASPPAGELQLARAPRGDAVARAATPSAAGLSSGSPESAPRRRFLWHRAWLV
jgi:hypothetical protein